MTMKASDYLRSPYFNASDFGDRSENWTIVGVSEEIIGRDDPTKKPVLELSDGNGRIDPRRLILNKTNLRTLAKAFGDDMKSWVGRPIRICSVPVTVRGEPTRGTRVMPGAVAVREPVRAATSGGQSVPDDKIPF